MRRATRFRAQLGPCACSSAWIRGLPHAPPDRRIDCFGKRHRFVCKLGIFSTVLAGFAFAPGVVATDGNLKSTTHGGNWIVPLVLSHELELQSWACEKVPMAFFSLLSSCCARSHSRLRR